VASCEVKPQARRDLRLRGDGVEAGTGMEVLEKRRFGVYVLCKFDGGMVEGVFWRCPRQYSETVRKHRGGCP
jgi:hypothetical protein